MQICWIILVFDGLLGCWWIVGFLPWWIIGFLMDYWVFVGGLLVFAWILGFWSDYWAFIGLFVFVADYWLSGGLWDFWWTIGFLVDYCFLLWMTWFSGG